MNLVRRYPVAATLALGAGAVLAFAVPAGAAVSVQSQSPGAAAVSLGKTAKVDANGAVVFPAIKYVCQPGAYAYLTVTVTEAVDGAIASGTATRGSSMLACTGTTQRIKVPVTPTQKPFKVGVAFGQVEFDTYWNGGSAALLDEHVIQIV